MASETSRSTPLVQRWISRRAANTVRFGLKNLFLIVGMGLISLGGWWIWLIPVLSHVLLVIAEDLVADIDETEEMPPAWYLNLMLWGSLPLLAMLTVLFMNVAGPGLAPVDAALRALGFQPDAARAATGWLDLVVGVVAMGAFAAMAGLNVAHELVHRTHSVFDRVIGRWLLAFTWDTGYAIDHVYGHHRDVGTERDPSTARRGEYIGAFVIRSTIGQNLSALRIERARLKRRDIADWPWNNRYWRGQAMSLALLAACWWMAGWTGAMLFLASALLGKAFHTSITYVEHYGLVRLPGTRVEPRHAWTSNRRISLGMLYNAPLHAEHHMFAERPFWKLQKGGGDTPLLPYGSARMVIIAYKPKKRLRVFPPLLADWDRRLASPGEREFLRSRGLLLG